MWRGNNRRWSVPSLPVKLTPKKIDQYARDHSSPEDPVLQALVEVTYAKAPLPQMQTGHVEGAFLRLLVKATGARLVLEIGTFTGYSSLAMAMGLPEDGMVITLDIDPEVTGIAKEYWAKSPHGFKIDLRLGPALETLKGLMGPFDLVFIDADKENYLNYWEACLPKVRSGGLLVVDNVLWGGSVLHPEQASDRAIVALNEYVANDQRVDAVLLTVRDGMTVACKR